MVRHRIARRQERTENCTSCARVSQGEWFAARGCAATARRVARVPAARKAAQVKVRSKFHAKNVETTKSSKLALAEELATLGGCEPIYGSVAHGRGRAG